VALARTGAWLTSLGRVDGGPLAPDPTADEVVDLCDEMPSTFGALRYVRPAGCIGGATPRWDAPPPARDADAPLWE
jgi:hypothetical protein